MKNIMTKLESLIEKAFDEFNKNPIKTSIKLIIAIWLLKKAYNWLNEEE